MSFIRCLSNPEGLYIYDDVSGYIAITCSTIRDSKGPVIIKVNRQDWYKLLKGYNQYKFYNGGMVGTLEFKEKFIPTGPWEEILPKGTRYTGGEKKGQLLPKHVRCHRPGDYKVMLTIRNPRERTRKIIMWRVTWDYIAAHGRCKQLWGHDKRKNKRH